MSKSNIAQLIGFTQNALDTIKEKLPPFIIEHLERIEQVMAQ